MSLQNSIAQASAETGKLNAEETRRLAQSIDHTKLTFKEGEDETEAIIKLCREAKTHGFYAVCVRPRHVRLAKQQLQGTPVKVATVIGFPTEKVVLSEEQQKPTIGQATTEEKVRETLQSIQDGADELDLVMNVGHLKQDIQTGSQQALTELKAIHTVAQGIPIKVIIEIDLLSPIELLLATEACAQTGMTMVKTSTGMVEQGQGATLEAVQRIAARLRELHSRIGIKASGGIKTRDQALAFLKAGVQRLGTSSGVAILKGETATPNAY